MKSKLFSLKLWVPAAVILLVLALSSSTFQDTRPVYVHDWEKASASGGGEVDENPLPEGSNSMFTGSGRCSGCHGHDPLGNASITEEGEDVNVSDDWQPTMMANSAKDPFWKAKVTHEIAINPSHSAELQDKCTSCHAPMGHFPAHFDGAPHYNLEMLAEDSLGLDGVSCNACHQQDPDSIGQFFSGDLRWVLDTLYGPIGDGSEEVPLFAQPMTSFVGYEPVYSSHISESELCAGCHTLITGTVDLEGEFTGDDFVEQATYHEWLNSAYSDEESPFHAECQGCHFPRLDEPIVISANYVFLPGRSPYGLHHMVGGNSFMLELMQSNIEPLGITANENDFDPVISRTLNALQGESGFIEMTDLAVEQDTAFFEIAVTNSTGHRLPSGYPSRRLYLEVVATDGDGNTLWQSGVMDEMYEVSGQNDDFEPHYQIIRSEEEVQIYEMVMADVEGGVTTVLERAAYPLKDNRLAPLGFSMDHPSYDTTLVAGAALTDLDWNLDEVGVEGTGADKVFYNIPLDGYEGPFNVSARLMYQSAPPKWMDEMFATDTPEIEQFETMYWESGPDPVEIDTEFIQLNVVGVETHDLSTASVYPNPTSDGAIEMYHPAGAQIQVYTATGQLVSQHQGLGVRSALQLPDATGVYVVVIRNRDEVRTERVLRR